MAFTGYNYDHFLKGKKPVALILLIIFLKKFKKS